MSQINDLDIFFFFILIQMRQRRERKRKDKNTNFRQNVWGGLTWIFSVSIEELSQLFRSSLSRWAGSLFCAAPRPSLLYALVFVSLSTTLNLSICCGQEEQPLQISATFIYGLKCWKYIKSYKLTWEFHNHRTPLCTIIDLHTPL